MRTAHLKNGISERSFVYLMLWKVGILTILYSITKNSQRFSLHLQRSRTYRTLKKKPICIFETSGTINPYRTNVENRVSS